MSVDKIKWHMKAFRQLRQERGIVSDLVHRGRAVADAAGAGVEATVRTGRTRGRVSVAAVTDEAKRKNAKENTILRALDAGR